MSLSLLNPWFLLLLAGIGLLRSLFPSRYFVVFGAISSILLVGWAAPATLCVILGTTLFYLYPVSWLMQAGQARGWSQRTGKYILGFAIAGLVTLLIVFKLYRHFPSIPLGGPWLHAQVTGLIGFSYFVFRAIGFLHIQSILKFEERSPLPLIFYSLFPSTITSGPIQKYQDFREQLRKPLPLTPSLLGEATYRITRGFFQKLVVAVILDGVVQKLIGGSYTSLPLSFVTIALLYLFFFFDFAGYSDIAIGFGLLLGVRIPENFRNPFQATTVSEFWRNWHITLADWFRDQVFIPLGGMRSSRLKAAAIAFVIMFLCGLWHGLTLNFVAWGVWHGGVLFSEALCGSKPIPPALRVGPTFWARAFWTNARVAVGAVFFLPAASIQHILHGLIVW